jgi:hypothetical protein
VKLWPLLPKTSILEFKSASKGYRARGLHRLLGYGHQYFSEHPELPAHADLALVLLVARRYEALDDDLRALSLREEKLAEGYARLHGAPFPLLLVDLRALASHERDDVVALFADGVPLSPAVDAWWYAHYGRKDNDMDPQQLEDFDDMRRRFLASVPLEERLAGATPRRSSPDSSPKTSSPTSSPRSASLASSPRSASPASPPRTSPAPSPRPTTSSRCPTPPCARSPPTTSPPSPRPRSSASASASAAEAAPRRAAET